MFEFITNLNVMNEPLVTKTLNAGVSCERGVALVEDVTTGNLVIAVGTAVPTCISAEKIASAGKGRVAPIRKEDMFKVTGSAGTYVLGAKYTLHASNGTAITNTTTSGVFTVKQIVSGTKVIGSF